VLFTAGLIGVVCVDLGLSARRHAPPSLWTSVIWVTVWLGLAMAFGAWLDWMCARDASLSYFAAYLTEDSLSLDNIAVFIAIFAYFGVPAAFQHRVLFWGVLGAVVMRGLMVFAGLELLERFSWVTYAFGAFLLFAGIRAVRRPVVRAERGGGILSLVARWIPVTECLDMSFFRRVGGRVTVTPLFVALVVIELSDAVFAVDSIPAVFGVTRDPFLVYSSNMLAVLGLRSLFFLVAGVLPRLKYLRFGLAAILAFVGAKMLLSNVVDVPAWVSLAFIAVAIGLATLASVVGATRRSEAGPADTGTRSSLRSSG
jgi:tellurite resistance protein TerC